MFLYLMGNFQQGMNPCYIFDNEEVGKKSQEERSKCELSIEIIQVTSRTQKQFQSDPC